MFYCALIIDRNWVNFPGRLIQKNTKSKVKQRQTDSFVNFSSDIFPV